MKVISKEEEQAHYNHVLKGGAIGGVAGLSVGLLGVLGASRRYPAFRAISLPFRTFLVTSTGTFAAIVQAESASQRYHKANNPMNFYKDESTRTQEALAAQESTKDRLYTWGRENRYTIVFGAWVASMGIALGAVGRNKYLTTSQKLVQARMYAQGLTLAVLIATAIFETADASSGKGRWETVRYIDPTDPEHKKVLEKRVHKEEYEGQDLWMDMVAAEEKRLNSQNSQKKGSVMAAVKEHEAKQKKDAEEESGDKKEASEKQQQ